MKKNKIKLLSIIVMFTVALISGFIIYKVMNKESGSNDTSIDKKEKTIITPILYEVTKEGSNNKMYLFGSIHLANNSDLNFPDYVLNAYNNSHYVACEYNIIEANSNLEKSQEMVMQMLYQDGTTVKDHIDIDVYNKLVDFLTNKKAYSSLYDYYKPVFFYSLMSNLMGKDANLTAESGVDEHFLKKAINDKKEILEVESMESQMDLLLSFSDSLYETAIIDIIDNYDDSIKEIKELYDNWKIGNEEKMIELNDEDIDVQDNYKKELKKEINDFNKKLVNDRNKTMTDKAVEYFNGNKDVFFMVGTLHIIGEDGIASNLKEKGYKVTRVK